MRTSIARFQHSQIQPSVCSPGSQHHQLLEHYPTIDSDRLGDFLLQNVSALCKQGQVEQAFDVLDGFEPPSSCATYESLLRSCNVLAEAKRVHGRIIRSGLERPMGDSLVAAYSRFGSLEDARRMFEKVSNPKVVSWNALVAAYAKSWSLQDARNLFEKMPDRNVVSWNIIITAFAQHGHVEMALELYERMLQQNAKPNRVTFISLLSACARPANLAAGKLIHRHIEDSGLDLDVVLGTALVNLYGKCKRLEDAREVFDKMRVRNIVSWNAMIALYNQLGKPNKSIQLFHRMQEEGIKPDNFTFAATIGACGNLTALTEGKLVHASILKNGIALDLVLGTALINMYGKCGIMGDAEKVFHKMPKQDVVSWSALIAAYAQHGDGRMAIHHFRQMQDAGVTPNDVTLVSVLAACNQACLVDEGRQVFDSMHKRYGIAATKEHYMCMVDLLGRAGLLDEAEKVVKKMPSESRSIGWMRLLCACKLHNNVERGKRAAQNVLKLDPKKRAAYVVLANIYSAVGRLEDAEKVRELMADVGLK